MGLLDAPAASRQALLSAQGRYGRRVPLTNRAQVLPTSLSNGTDTEGLSRIQHNILVSGSSIVMRYIGSYDVTGTGTETVAPIAQTIQCAIEYGGTIYPCTFGGASTGVLNPGLVLDTDPLAIDLVAGTTMFSRNWVTIASGSYAVGAAPSIGGAEGWAHGTALSNTVNGGAVSFASATTPMFGPSAITGYPSQAVPSVCVIGDSIAAGSVDFPGPGGIYTGGGGYFARIFDAASMSYQKVVCPAEKGSQFAAQSGRVARALMLNSGYTDMICEYGINDIRSSATLAAVQAAQITIWNLIGRRSARAWQTTITPCPTSTDSWATLANQTTASYEPVRLNVNAWLRAGAPMLAGAAVAIGTTNAITCAVYSSTGALVQAASVAGGHPLSGVFEIADIAESARNSGKWVVPGVTGTVTTNSTTVVSITAGGPVVPGLVPVGAGLGAANLINSITGGGTSGGTFTMQSNASASASGVALTTAYTVDGLHPGAALHAIIAASGAIPTALFTV